VQEARDGLPTYIYLKDILYGESEDGRLEGFAVGGDLENVGQVAPVGLDIKALVRKVAFQDVQQNWSAAGHQLQDETDCVVDLLGYFLGGDEIVLLAIQGLAALSGIEIAGDHAERRRDMANVWGNEIQQKIDVGSNNLLVSCPIEVKQNVEEFLTALWLDKWCRLGESLKPEHWNYDWLVQFGTKNSRIYILKYKIVASLIPLSMSFHQAERFSIKNISLQASHLRNRTNLGCIIEGHLNEFGVLLEGANERGYFLMRRSRREGLPRCFHHLV
jgi:hypothetical protein